MTNLQTELWQEYDRAGNPIGQGRNPYDFYDNTEHICSVPHVWLYRKSKSSHELLFQKRSQTVLHNAGEWDVSAAGHINAGESIQDAAVRECAEELGVIINKSNLKFVVSFFDSLHGCIHHVYLCPWDGSDDFQFNDGEVAEVRWIPEPEVNKFVQQSVKRSIAGIDWYWKVLLENLREL